MTAGAAEGLSGLVIRDASLDEREVSLLDGLETVMRRRETRILTHTSPVAMFPPDRTIPGNVFFTEGARSLFDLLCVGANIRTFHGSWARGWYHHLNELLTPDGHVVLPVQPDERAARDASWNRSQLAALFGSDPTPVGNSHLRFARNPAMRAPRSLLSWFISDAPGIVHGHLLARTSPQALEAQRLDDMFLEFSLDGAERIVTRPRQLMAERGFAGGTNWFAAAASSGDKIAYAGEFSAVLRSIAYLISGLSNKTPVLSHIIRTRCPSPRASILDIGGAYGFVVAELLLDEDLELERGVCCDMDSAYLAGAMRMYRALRPDLAGRFFFSLNRAEEFAYHEQYSVVTLLSSLLYIPFEHRLPVLERAWENLQPGGVLVVYEVLKSAPTNKDYAIQFTSTDLDELLGRFGTVERISATGVRELTREEAGEASIFRFVVKSR